MTVNAKQVAIVLGVAGVGAGALYWYLTPSKYSLTVKALADTTEVAVDVTVDHMTNPTPFVLDLDQGTYTLTAPEEIIVNGETYYYSGYEEV